MKVTMIRKVSNESNWNSEYEALKMQGGADKDEVVIEKTITIPLTEYNEMLNNLLKDNHYIIENLKLMHQDENNVWHCLKITARGSKTSLIVDGEGYFYGRYTSIITKK